MKLLIVIGVLLLAGCAGTFQKLDPDYSWSMAPSDQRHRDSAVALIKSTLKDPESAKFEFSTPIRAYINEGWLKGGKISWVGWMIPVSVNAKNGFGGYTGYELYYVRFNGDYPIDATPVRIWNAYRDAGVYHQY